MSKQPISVTLSRENLLWLRSQTRATATRSISETLDRLVSETRTGGRLRLGAPRSVVGTIRIAPSDSSLTRADVALRALFSGPPPRRGPDQSLARDPGDDGPTVADAAVTDTHPLLSFIFQADAARPNRDPFDALICVAARQGTPPANQRREIRNSGLVRVIW